MTAGTNGASEQFEGRSKAWQSLESSAQRLVQGDEQAWHELVGAMQDVALPVLRAYWRRLDPKEKHSPAEDAARDVFVRVLERMRANNFAALQRYFCSHKIDEGSEDDQPDQGESAETRCSFKGYMRTILRRAAVDYLRLEPRYRRASREKRQSGQDGESKTNKGRWHSFVSAHSRIGAARDPVTLRATAMKMLEYLDTAYETACAYVEQMAATDHAEEATTSRQTYDSLAGLIGLSVQEGPQKGTPDWAAARDLFKRGEFYRDAIELEIQGYSQEEIAESLGLTRRMAQTLLERAKNLLRLRFCEESTSLPR